MPKRQDLPENLQTAQSEGLPTNWKALPLGEVATLQRGNDLPKSQRTHGSYPVIGSNGIVGYHSKAVAHGPGVLVGRSGSVGKVTWVEHDYWPLNTTLWVKDFHGNDPEFVYQLLEFIDLSKFAAGVSVPTLNRNLVHPVKVATPSLPEQRAIANVLRTVQKAIETTEKVIETSRELKRSLMNHLFTYGPVAVNEAEQVPLKETEIGHVPEHWKLTTLGAVSKLLSGGTPSKKRAEWWQGDIPWASPKDLKVPRLEDTKDHISEEALNEGSRLAPAGTILIVVRGMILARDLPVTITKVPMAFNQDLKAIVPKADIEPDYLFYTLTAHKKLLAKEIGTSAHGTRRLGSSALEGWVLPLPTREEQRQTSGAIHAVDKKIEAEVKRKQTLMTLFKTLLNNLMTGKVRVGDLNLPEMEETVR